MAGLISILGVWSLSTMKVDVLPDINKPTVAVFAEAEGLAPEEVERLVLTPLESAVSGAPGVERVRGTASFGLAIVNAEFSWGSDIFRNRQIIQERISRLQLPEGVRPVLGPVGSIMGEIMWAGLTSDDGKVDGMQLRTLADWTIRPALLRVPGVSDVIVLGGDVREWQVNTNAEQMRRYGLRIEDIAGNIGTALNNKSGGLLVQGGKEYPLRVLIAPSEIAELQDIAIGNFEGRPIRLADVAVVQEGASPVRGSATIDGKPGVILRVAKQPEAETLKVTEAVDKALKSLTASLPQGVELKNDLFRQEWFIHAGLSNILGALRDGVILVIIILILFLMNVRITLITLTSIPLSIFVTAIAFRYFGFSVNVMTLGGLALAIGSLVDDSIVYVENIFRRLREWRNTGTREPANTIIFKASAEVRNAIIYATVLVVIVFLPLFFIPGVEGRLLASLGAAYLISLVASLLVSLTVVPALASLLLIQASHKEGGEQETKFVQAIKRWMRPGILWSIHNAKIVLVGTVATIFVAGGLYFMAGKEGIPPFNEGSATISVVLPVGTDLNTSNKFASEIEDAMRSIEGVRRVSHITGRAGADPHDSGANSSEIQVVFEPGLEGEAEELFKELQKILDTFPGADYSLGQPITHRVEELLSGVRAPIVMKVFGDDLVALRQTAEQIQNELAKQPGVKNPQVQKEVMLPEFRIYPDRNRLAEYGVSSGELAEELEQGLLGEKIGQVQQGSARIDVVARYDLSSRGNSDALRDLSLPFTGAESLGGAADIKFDAGRNRFSHEGGKRILVVSANYQGSDIVGAVENVRTAMNAQKLPSGQEISYEGTYKSQKENSGRLTILFIFGLLLIFGVLYKAFKSTSLVLLIMLTIPTVLIGGMIGVWLTGGIINLAHLVGLIALTGIVARNGIMLIGRCLSLVRTEGKPFTPETILQGSLERTVPVLMTFLTTALGLIPLMLAGNEPGKELLNPLAVVIFGGLISSTMISLFIIPSVFYRFGKKAAMQSEADTSGF